MILLGSGNLLAAAVDALVNPVNCAGVMGRGLALAFKKRLPWCVVPYVDACRRGELQPGRVLVVESPKPGAPRFVIHFPTKRHWREASRIEDIDAGLPALAAEIERHRITSIAVPALGCGLGGLAWDDVRPRIERALASVRDLRAVLYGPER